MVVDVLIVGSSEIKDGWDVGGVDSQIFSEPIEKSVSIILVRKSENDSFWLGFIECFKGLLGSN